MPEKRTMKKARAAKRAGKAPSTQAGEFVHEEIEHVRKGKHGARSTKQVIAIGLSKARRAGVKLPPPPSRKTRRAPRRSGNPASTKALSRQATNAARRRPAAARKRSAQKAARTRRRRASA
jgi:hypothetical protein